jgi:hypothetical protein
MFAIIADRYVFEGFKELSRERERKSAPNRTFILFYEAFSPLSLSLSALCDLSRPMHVRNIFIEHGTARRAGGGKEGDNKNKAKNRVLLRLAT